MVVVLGFHVMERVYVKVQVLEYLHLYYSGGTPEYLFTTESGCLIIMPQGPLKKAKSRTVYYPVELGLIHSYSVTI